MTKKIRLTDPQLTVLKALHNMPCTLDLLNKRIDSKNVERTLTSLQNKGLVKVIGPGFDNKDRWGCTNSGRDYLRVNYPEIFRGIPQKRWGV